MPRNVRNFWLKTQVDGRATTIETGPQASDGGFVLEVLMRDQGAIVKAGELRGHVDPGGELVLSWENGESKYLTVLERRKR